MEPILDGDIIPGTIEAWPVHHFQNIKRQIEMISTWDGRFLIKLIIVEIAYVSQPGVVHLKNGLRIFFTTFFKDRRDFHCKRINSTVIFLIFSDGKWVCVVVNQIR